MLLIVLVVSAVAMGATYAAWSENITVAGTVSTGNVDVNFVNRDFPIQIPYGTYGYGSPHMNVNVAINPQNPKLLDVTINNLYPGGIAIIGARIKNEGTIPVKFSNATLTVNPSDSAVLPYLYAFPIVTLSQTGSDKITDMTFVADVAVFAPLSNLADTLNNSVVLKNTVLQPGGWMSFSNPANYPADYPEEIRALMADFDPSNSIIFWLNDSAPNSTQGQSITFTLGLEFKQWNK